MNKFFIKSSLDEIKVLQDSNMDAISNILKDYSKLLKTNKIEYEYSNFLKDFANYNITQKKISKFLNRKFKDGKVSDYIEIKKDETTKEYQLNILKYDEVFDVYKGLSAFEKKSFQFQIAITSPIIGIITLYESFIRKLISTDCFEGNFELINNECLNFEQLQLLNYDKEAIKNYLIESYCNNKLYGDKKRIREIISMLGIDCQDSIHIVEDFEEIYFRRNMYVHSIPNLTKDYISLPTRIKDKWVKDGSLLNSPEYFKHAFKTLNMIVLLILIKKCLFKEKNKKDLTTISELIYENFYDCSKYEIASFGYNQLRKLNWITDIQRYYFFVNYMVCLKYTNTQQLEKELASWNTSTAAPIFKLAKKLISNDYANINRLIISVLKSDEDYEKLEEGETDFYIIKEYVDSWPLFKDYRKTEHYLSLFKSKK